ncbi:unnamed protein product [Rhizophagus irregularis]|nr:unnamed protein product [Rhizophagus irregularis]
MPFRTGKPPASPAGTKRKADEEMVDDIREIKKDVKDLVKERSAVNISSVNREDWQRILDYTGLNIDTIEPDVGSNPVKNVPAFKWNDVLERAQKDRYIHLRDTVDGVNLYQAMAELVAADLQVEYSFCGLAPQGRIILRIN